MGEVRVPRRLVVLAPNWLGDAVMALPLLADLHRAWPESQLTVAARAAVAPLFAMFPGVADTIRLEGSGGTALATWRHNARLLAAGGFDAALLLPNSVLAAWLVSRARIPERWGFARDLRSRLLTRAIARPPRGAHQAAYYQALAPALGVATGGRTAHIVPPADALARARTLLGEAGIPDAQPFVVFAPGAAYGRAKQWLPERFAELATLVAGQRTGVVLVGTAADAGACAEVKRLAGSAVSSAVVDVSGRTDLATLAAILSLSAGTFANDSGAMHLAGVVGARLVALFGPTSARQTAPLRAHADAPAPVILSTNVWCRPCMLRECPLDHRCMRRISARMAFEALDSDDGRKHGGAEKK
jgi:heptosyltransferase-2